MKRILNIILALTTAFIVAMFAGCGLGGAIDKSRDTVDAYYEAFSDSDIQTVVDLMHPSLVENLGGEEAALEFFSSIRAVHGEAVSYKHTGFEIDGSGKSSLAEFTVDTTYKNGDPTTDTFSVVNEDGVYSIVSIDIPTAGTIEALSESFRTAMLEQDSSKLHQSMLSAVRNTIMIEDVDAFLTEASSYYGVPQSVSQSEYFGNYYTDIDGSVYVVGFEYITFLTPEGEIEVEVVYAVNDGEVGIYSVNY